MPSLRRTFLKHRALARWAAGGMAFLAAGHFQTASAGGGGPDAAAVLAMPPDSAKVLQLSDLCFAYRRTDPDSARQFGEAALALARQLGFPRGAAQALNDLAILRIDRSDYAAADSLLRRSLAIRVQLHDSAGMAAVHNKLGIIFQARLMLEEALEEDRQALRIYERTGPPAHEATILNNIGILQFNLRRLDDALNTHRQAAEIRAQIGDSSGLATSWGNMANVELQLGDTAPAIARLGRAIAFFRQHGQLPELAVQLNNLAGIHLARGELAAAEKGYAEALSIRHGAGDRKAIASSMIGLGGIRLRQGRTAEADRLLHGALALGRAVNARNEQLQALLDLARLHARLGQADSSFAFHQQYAALKDSIFNADLNARLAQAEAKFETERKERKIQAQRAEIAELERRAEEQKLWTLGILAGALLAGLTALLVLQVQRRRARARQDALIIAEREAGLRGVLEATEQERKRIASELHDSVGQQLTGLRFSLEEIASAAQRGKAPDGSVVQQALALADDTGREVRHIAHAMMPKALSQLGLGPALEEMLQRALGPAGIAHEVGADGLRQRLPQPVETGVYRIAQELVQNTMKHAGAREVNLQLLVNNGHLVMIYEDDGKGLGPAPKKGGIGLRNIQERARALHGTVHFAPGTGQGLVATLRVPLAAGAFAKDHDIAPAPAAAHGSRAAHPDRPL